ncbi:MAG: energy transducer TonB, partial [Acidobacteriota bacterium]
KNRVYVVAIRIAKEYIGISDKNKFLSSFKVLSEPASTPEPPVWKTFSTTDFTVEIPDTPFEFRDQITLRPDKTVLSGSFFIDNDSTLYTISYCVPGLTASTQSQNTMLFDYLRDHIISNFQSKVLSEAEIKLAGCSGKELTIQGKSWLQIPIDMIIKARILLINDRLYLMAAATSNSKLPEHAERFFSSVKLDMNSTNTQEINNSRLPEDLEKFFSSVKLGINYRDTQEKVVSVGTPGLRLPQLYDKTKPLYTEEARRNKIEGMVVLSVIFYKDGNIGDIKIIRGLGYGLDEQAIEAAKKIRFKPAELNGEAVSVRARLEFTFTLLDKEK